jgi:flagellar biosynthesis protein
MPAPRHQAIALAYGQHSTPVVSAKGEDDVAQAMVEQAQKLGIFVSKDPQLLAVLSRLEVDQEIPPELFNAVAVVLAWVYWLKGMRPGDENQASR